jgi:hypothetical protein
MSLAKNLKRNRHPDVIPAKAGDTPLKPAMTIKLRAFYSCVFTLLTGTDLWTFNLLTAFPFYSTLVRKRKYFDFRRDDA